MDMLQPARARIAQFGVMQRKKSHNWIMAKRARPLCTIRMTGAVCPAGMGPELHSGEHFLHYQNKSANHHLSRRIHFTWCKQSRAELQDGLASTALFLSIQYPKWYAAQQALRSARSSPKNKIVPDWPESKDTSLYTSNMCPLPRWMHCIHGTPMVQVYGRRTNACTGASPFARIDPRLYRG